MMDQELLEEELMGPADTLEEQSKEKKIRDDLFCFGLVVLFYCVALATGKIVIALYKDGGDLENTSLGGQIRICTDSQRCLELCML